jgi:EpsI family protein
MSVRARLLIVTALLLATHVYLARRSRSERVPIHDPLETYPISLSGWRGQPAPDFDQRTLGVLGVDDYLNRIYLNARGEAVGLYVGFYGSQRQGDTMHSPLNCLPGAGWSPVAHDHLTIEIPGQAAATALRRERAIDVNRYVIEKGLDRQVVLYWYQSHGRVVASEYWGKIYTVLDAISMNRTDGALVRVIAPVTTSPADAERRAVDFVRALFPPLERYLPS